MSVATMCTSTQESYAQKQQNTSETQMKFNKGS